jgi:hypothetical protein
MIFQLDGAIIIRGDSADVLSINMSFTWWGRRCQQDDSYLDDLEVSSCIKCCSFHSVASNDFFLLSSMVPARHNFIMPCYLTVA